MGQTWARRATWFGWALVMIGSVVLIVAGVVDGSGWELLWGIVMGLLGTAQLLFARRRWTASSPAD